jgi:hypothetical protein
MLQQVIDGDDVKNCLVQSYKRSFNGFASILNDQQREILLGMRGVLSVSKPKVSPTNDKIMGLRWISSINQKRSNY